jgi:hypothetical protein
MGINVTVKHGDGRVIREVYEEATHCFALSRLVSRAWKTGVEEDFPFLTAIDLYGDTTFNQIMAQRLGAELGRTEARDEEEIESIALLQAACAEVAGAPAFVLRLEFLGD